MKICLKCNKEFDKTKLDEMKVYFSLTGTGNDYCSVDCFRQARYEASLEGRLNKLESEVDVLRGD